MWPLRSKQSTISERENIVEGSEKETAPKETNDMQMHLEFVSARNLTLPFEGE